jgi:hypothetical protein
MKSMKIFYYYYSIHSTCFYFVCLFGLHCKKIQLYMCVCCFIYLFIYLFIFCGTVRFIDIGGIVDHHYLNYLSIL